MAYGNRSDGTVPDLTGAEIQLPATIARNEARVRAGFWRKFLRVASFIPFGEDLLAAYYCATDADVPLRVWLREHCPEDADWSHRGRSQSRPPAMVRGKNLGRQ